MLRVREGSGVGMVGFVFGVRVFTGRGVLVFWELLSGVFGYRFDFVGFRVFNGMGISYRGGYRGYRGSRYGVLFKRL